MPPRAPDLHIYDTPNYLRIVYGGSWIIRKPTQWPHMSLAQRLAWTGRVVEQAIADPGRVAS